MKNFMVISIVAFVLVLGGISIADAYHDSYDYYGYDDGCGYDCGGFDFGFEIDFGCGFYDCGGGYDYYDYDELTYYVGQRRPYNPPYIPNPTPPAPPRNQNPICADVSKNVRTGENVSFTVSAHDYDRDVLTATSFGLPFGSQFDGLSRFFSWTPAENQAGSYVLNFHVTDGKGGACDSVARISVSPRPVPVPTPTPAPAPVIPVRQPVYVPVYVPSPAPAPTPAPVTPVRQAAYNANTNTSANTNINTNTNTIVINGLADLLRGTGVQYNGQPINKSAPYFTTTPITNARANQTYAYWAQARDNDGDPVSFRLLSLPASMTINPLTGFVTWTPTASQAGVHQVVIEVSDSLYQTIQSFAVIVAPANAASASVYVPARNNAVSNPNSQTTNNSEPQTVLVAPGQGTLFAFNVRVDRDENGNTIVLWDTNQPSRGAVMYGLASQGSRTSDFTYEYNTPEHPELTTSHRVVLGELEIDRTYYFRTVSSVGNATHISQEFSFLQLPTGAVGGEGLASAFSTLGKILINPILLVVLLIILIIYFIVRRRRAPEEISATGPIEIKAAH